MIPEELEERLTDAERVLALHGKRLEKLEQRSDPAPARPEQQNEGQTNPAPDFSGQFEELKKLLKRHDLSVQALQIYAQISSFRDTIAKLPKVLPVRHHHHFEGRSRSFLIAGAVLLLVTAISAGICLSLYRENRKLQESDIKLRMIRQTYPKAVIGADSVYHLAPEEAEAWVKQKEAKLLSTP